MFRNFCAKHILITTSTITISTFILPTTTDAANPSTWHWDLTRPADFYKLESVKAGKICEKLLKAFNTPADARNISDELWMLRHSLVILSNPLEIDWGAQRLVNQNGFITEESHVTINNSDVLARRTTGSVGGYPSQEICLLQDRTDNNQCKTINTSALKCWGSCSQTIVNIDNTTFIATAQTNDKSARINVGTLPDVDTTACSFMAKKKFDHIGY